MFVHSVYFWLRDDLTDAQRQTFLDGVQSLRRIASVRQSFLGTPADTDRPVIDNTYSHALIAVFDDVAGHDHYQTVDVHDRFREECGPLWSRVQIYDIATES